MPGVSTPFGELRSGIYEIPQGYDNVEEFSLPVPDSGSTLSGLVEFREGEWVTRDGDGNATRVTSSPKMAWPVVTGAERSDYRGSGSVTVAMGVQYHAITDKFQLGNGVAIGDYAVGTNLTVDADPADGIGKLRPAAGAEVVFAVCMSPVKLFLLAEDEPLSPASLGNDPEAEGVPSDQLGNLPTQVIEIQVVR
jgi:hypothetical protein